MDEQTAIRRLKQDDISGLEFLVSCHQAKAVRTAYLITRDPGLAEDIVQESFIQAYHSIRSFDSTRPFGPWFMRSVVNASVKVMQRSSRQVQVGDQTILDEIAARAESAEAQAASIELQDQIWDAMQRLSPRQRAVIVQRYFLDMSEKDMAVQAGTAVGTIKWLLNAARERLRGLLERSDE